MDELFPYALYKENLSPKGKVCGTVVAPLQSVSTDTQQHSSDTALLVYRTNVRPLKRQ